VGAVRCGATAAAVVPGPDDRARVAA